MRITIDQDTLDITYWFGKKQKLQNAICKECLRRSLDNTLPYKLIMTPIQYEMLKKVREMGQHDEYKYYKPEQRIYCTPYNCLEIIIKD